MRYSLFFLLVIVLASCSSEKSKLIGRWKLMEIDYSPFYEDSEPEVRAFIEEKMNYEFERLKDKTFFEFKDNDSLILETPNFTGAITNTLGTFVYVPRRDSIYFNLSERESYKIQELTEEKLVLSTDESPARILRLSKY